MLSNTQARIEENTAMLEYLFETVKSINLLANDPKIISCDSVNK
jgi:hypothetical protein